MYDFERQYEMAPFLSQAQVLPCSEMEGMVLTRVKETAMQLSEIHKVGLPWQLCSCELIVQS